MNQQIEGKVCSKCGKWKPLSDFYSQKGGKYGRRARCISCKNEIDREESKEYRTKNRELLNEKARRYNEERAKRRGAIYVGRGKMTTRRLRRLTTTEYYQKYPWIKAAHRSSSRANANGAVGKFTGQEWKELCDKYDNKCLCCGEEVKLTVDHIVPLSKGGTNYISNVQPLCISCNARKSNKIIDYRKCVQ